MSSRAIRWKAESPEPTTRRTAPRAWEASSYSPADSTSRSSWVANAE